MVALSCAKAATASRLQPAQTTTRRVGSARDVTLTTAGQRSIPCDSTIVLRLRSQMTQTISFARLPNITTPRSLDLRANERSNNADDTPRGSERCAATRQRNGLGLEHPSNRQRGKCAQ